MRTSRISTSPPAASSSCPLMSPKTSIASAPKPAAPVTSTCSPSPRSACARSRTSVTESRNSSPLPPVSRTWVTISAASPSRAGSGPSVPAVIGGGSSFRLCTSARAWARSAGVSRPSSRAMTVTAAAVSPAGKRSICCSALTDSASPGRKEVASFSWASSNLPDSGPTAATRTSAIARTKNFGMRRAGRVKSFDTGERPKRRPPWVRSTPPGGSDRPASEHPLRGGARRVARPAGFGCPYPAASSSSSCAGSVTGMRQAKCSHT